MKISAALVRRLRAERGWSQDQLAMASGLSLRTIQRVEAEGVASMGSKVSLAATFGVHLSELADEAADAGIAVGAAEVATPRLLARLLLGLAVLSLAMIGESGRWPGSPTADGMLALNLLFAAVGALLAAPAAIRLLRERRVATVALAIIGTPFAVMLAGGLLVAMLRGHAPHWPLLALGTGGLALLAMALRDSARPMRG